MSAETPSFAQPDSKPATGMSGKNALLARIQAAKAKSQQTAAKPAPATTDLFDVGAPAPAAPSKDLDLLGGMTPAPAPAATNNASTFETLMATTTQPTPGPPSTDAQDLNQRIQTLEDQVAVTTPPPAAEAASTIDEDILAALDPAEREALLREQQQIMQEIERKKAAAPKPLTGAAASAAAFNQRSSAAVADLAASMDGSGATTTTPAFARPPPFLAASKNGSGATTTTTTPRTNGNTVDLGHGESVPLHGNQQTDQAIKDGTALVVQCMNCNNWMQVTGEASLMLCPVCGVVCPVEKTGATADMETAAQVAADQQLAEELQKEEYKEAANYRERRRTENQVTSSGQGGQSWIDWLAGTPAPAPGAANGIRSPPRSPDERQGLIANGQSPSRGARVAQQPQSLFACVADSVAAAAEQMTGIQLKEDKEGNVHGVDSSSLLI